MKEYKMTGNISVKDGRLLHIEGECKGRRLLFKDDEEFEGTGICYVSEDQLESIARDGVTGWTIADLMEEGYAETRVSILHKVIYCVNKMARLSNSALNSFASFLAERLYEKANGQNFMDVVNDCDLQGEYLRWKKLCLKSTTLVKHNNK